MGKIKVTKHGSKYRAFVYNKYTKKKIPVTAYDENTCRFEAEKLKYDIKMHPEKYVEEKVVIKTTRDLDQTVEYIFNFWLDNKNDCIKDTKEDYRGIFRNHLKAIAEMPLRELNDDVIQVVYTSILNGETVKKPNKNNNYTNTVLRVHRCLRCFVNYLYKKKIIDVNYMDFVTIPKKTRFEHTQCSIEYYKNILALLKSEPDHYWLYMLVVISGCVGLRIGEALGIDIRNITPTYIDITQQVAYRQGQGYVISETLKNNKSKRKAPIASLNFVTKELQEYMVARQNYINRCRLINPNFAKEHEHLLFINDKGTLIPTNTADRAWKLFKKKYNINPDLRMHDFRRFFATLLLINDVPDKVSQEALGHTEVDMTKYYQNVNMDMVCGLINNVNI